MSTTPNATTDESPAPDTGHNPNSTDPSDVPDTNIDWTPLMHSPVLDDTKEQVQRADELVKRAEGDIQHTESELRSSEDRGKRLAKMIERERSRG
ncbi:hypothetical protein HDV00_000895 [Rhizophlyctis rosea]|nr:hypothetical protein HDV00_000895 [Rhizophlyctis rosea]